MQWSKCDLEVCLENVKKWRADNKMKLKEKTRHDKIMHQIGDASIQPAQSVKDPGVLLDKFLTCGRQSKACILQVCLPLTAEHWQK